MSLNRTEQAIVDYWQQAPDERRHWQGKVSSLAPGGASLPEVARALERDLWDYLVERTPHVPTLRNLHPAGLSRTSMLNLAEYLLRLWGPPPKPRRAQPTG